MTGEFHPNQPPLWIPATQEHQWIAVVSQCTLSRNLADFPFPVRCNDDERRAVETRAMEAFERMNLPGKGHYHAAADLDSISWQFLAERRLVSRELLHNHGPRGVYAAESHDFSIMVNGSDHLVFRGLAGGLAVRDAWSRVNAVDDGLGRLLDFAYQERLGFLTSRLGMVGTGLRASVLLSLPALTMLDKVEEAGARIRQRGAELYGVAAGDPDLRGFAPGQTSSALYGTGSWTSPTATTQECLLTDLEGAVCVAPKQAVGDLYLLVNQDTLGVSEDEILFRVGHAAVEMVREESRALNDLLALRPREVEDRYMRAGALVRGTRLLGFAEAAELLSWLRVSRRLDLGPGNPPLDLIPPARLTELLMQSQAAHLLLQRGANDDPQWLSLARSQLFCEAFRQFTN